MNIRPGDTVEVGHVSSYAVEGKVVHVPDEDCDLLILEDHNDFIFITPTGVVIEKSKSDN